MYQSKKKNARRMEDSLIGFWEELYVWWGIPPMPILVITWKVFRRLLR